MCVRSTPRSTTRCSSSPSPSPPTPDSERNVRLKSRRSPRFPRGFLTPNDVVKRLRVFRVFRKPATTTKRRDTRAFRLLNLAHVLFLSQAGEREHAVTGARRLRRAGRFFSTPSRFVSSRDARNARGRNDEGSSLDESLGDEATRRVSDPSDDSIGDSGARRGVDAVAVAATAGTNAESLADVRTDSDVRTPRRERFFVERRRRGLSPRVRTRRG